MAHDSRCEGGLPRTIGTHESVDFPGLKAEGYVMENFFVSDGCTEMLEGDHRVSV